MPDFKAVARSENDVLKDVVRRTDRSVVVPGSAAGCSPGETGTDPMDARISPCDGTRENPVRGTGSKETFPSGGVSPCSAA